MIVFNYKTFIFACFHLKTLLTDVSGVEVKIYLQHWYISILKYWVHISPKYKMLIYISEKNKVNILF